MTRINPLIFDGFIQMLSTGWNIGRGLYCNLETELMASTLAQEVAGGEEFEMFIIEYQGWLVFCNKTFYYQLCNDEVFSLSSPDHLHGQREDDC